MKRRALLSACVILIAFPTPLLACGGCTDAVLLMTLPWAGFGGVFLWAWVFTMLGVRKRLRRRGSEGAQTLVRGSTLGVFSILGSAGYVVLSFLTMGSLLLPSLVVGFIWAVYLAIRLIVDIFRIVFRKDSRRGASVVINCVFLLGVLVVVVCFQAKANSLEHQIGALRYGTHTEMFSKIMPAIVARGEEAVVPLIEATNEAMANDDQYYRSNIVVHASFCLSQIGGPDAEKFLADILKQHREPDDFGYRHGYKAVHFAYARCAGPRAVQDLIHVYERMPKDAEQNDRWIPLVALLITASKEGVAYVLDHFDDLLSAESQAAKSVFFGPLLAASATDSAARHYDGPIVRFQRVKRTRQLSDLLAVRQTSSPRRLPAQGRRVAREARSTAIQRR